MTQKIKDIDEQIKKAFKNSIKDSSYKDLIEFIFATIADSPTHPLLTVIETALQTLMTNITQIAMAKKSENTQIAIYIKSLINQTTIELNDEIVSYFHYRKWDGMVEYLENIIFDLCFETIRDLFFNKEYNRDVRYELQCTKLKPFSLREILKMESPKYPEEDLDIVFDNSIKLMGMLDKANTLDTARDIVVKVHQSIMNDLARYNNGEARKDFVTDDFIDALIYLLVKSDIIHLYGMISFMEGFMTSNDDCSQFGFSMRNLQIAARAVVLKL